MAYYIAQIKHLYTSQVTVHGTGCIRDIPVPNPTGGGAVQIGCPADLSGIPDRNDGILATTGLVYNDERSAWECSQHRDGGA